MRYKVLLLLLLLNACSWASTIGLVERNYSGNYSATNRFWFYKNLDGSSRPDGNGQYPDLEWQSGRGENFPVVLNRNGTATITLKFYNPQFFAQTGTLQINGARLRIPGKVVQTWPSSGSLPPDQLKGLYIAGGGQLSFPAEDYKSVTVTLSGIPNYVTRGTLEVDAEITGQAQWTTGGYAAWEGLYVVTSTPQALQAVPWTDLLDYSCDWAHGEAAPTQVAKKITFGIFWNDKGDGNTDFEGDEWIYSGSGVWFWDPYYNVYDLSKRLGSPSSVNMDCRDVSGFNLLANSAVGVTASCTKLKEPYSTIVTNEICPMGSNASILAYYDPIEWTFHQIMTVDTLAHDAAAAQWRNLSGGSYRNPPANWPVLGYWQTPYSNPVFIGLVDHPGYESVSTPTSVVVTTVVLQGIK